MKLDSHIHIFDMDITDNTHILGEFEKAGLGGGVLISYRPDALSLPFNSKTFTPRQRLDHLFECAGGQKNLFPFFWIDPMEEDAVNQVDLALSYGVLGFKVICKFHFPGDEKAMKVYRAIAKTGKPILFHSGMLSDNYTSSDYNKPLKFEALFDIEGLRFATAHMGWPWSDETIALYYKFKFARRENKDIELFLDLTPGTPDIYKEEVYPKMVKLNIGMTDHMMYGTDNLFHTYSHEYSKHIIKTDNEIYDKLGLPDSERDKIFGGNLLKFIYGKDGDQHVK